MKRQVIRIKGIPITPETIIKIVNIDEDVRKKKEFKLNKISKDQIQDIIDLYSDLYLIFENEAIPLNAKDTGKVLNVLTNSKIITESINSFVLFEEEVSNNIDKISK